MGFNRFRIIICQLLMFSILIFLVCLSVTPFLQHVEDKSLLNGHIAMILSEYDKAQDLFLASPEPNTALEV